MTTSPLAAPLSVGPADVPSRRSRARRVLLVVLLVAMLLATATGLWLLWDNRRLVVTRYEVPVAGLPAQMDGARIVQLSDLHAEDFGDFHQRLESAVAQARPDLIALTGDMIDVRTDDIEPTVQLLGDIAHRAPTVSILGNHEADSPHRDQLIDELAARGIPTLRDEVLAVPIRGGSLAVIGIDDPRVAHAAGHRAPEADGVIRLLDVPQGMPQLLLAHRPERFDEYARSGVDVVLSGHAHGGQVRLPGIGGVYAPHQGLWPEYTSGVHEQDGTRMVISRGLGNSIAAVRVNDPRELVVITLRRA